MNQATIFRILATLAMADFSDLKVRFDGSIANDATQSTLEALTSGGEH